MELGERPERLIFLLGKFERFLERLFVEDQIDLVLEFLGFSCFFAFPAAESNFNACYLDQRVPDQCPCRTSGSPFA